QGRGHGDGRPRQQAPARLERHGARRLDAQRQRLEAAALGEGYSRADGGRATGLHHARECEVGRRRPVRLLIGWAPAALLWLFAGRTGSAQIPPYSPYCGAYPYPGALVSYELTPTAFGPFGPLGYYYRPAFTYYNPYYFGPPLPQ